MNRREFILGAAASAAVAAVPAAVAAPPFEDIDPDGYYNVWWHICCKQTGMFGEHIEDAWLWRGKYIVDLLVGEAAHINPESPARDLRYDYPTELRDSPGHSIVIDEAWLREFYRRHG